MAGYNGTRNNVTNISFNVSGYDAVLKSMQETTKQLKARLKSHDELMSGLKSEDAMYQKLAASRAKIAAEWDKADKALKNYQKDFSDASRFASQYDVGGPKILSSGIRNMEKMIKRMQLTSYDEKTGKYTMPDEGDIQKLEAAVRIIDISKARMASMLQGVYDVTKALKDETRGFVELGQAVTVYEKYGRQLARTAEDEEAAFRAMGVAATDAKVRMAEMDGQIVKVGSGASAAQLTETAKFFKDIQSYAGASEEQIRTFKERYKEVQAELANVYGERITNSTAYSQKEVEESIAFMKQYRTEVAGNAEAEAQLTSQIKAGEEALRLRKEQNSLPYFTEQYQKLGTVSADSLKEQIKYWDDVAKHAEMGSDKYLDATEKVRGLNEELQRRNVATARSEGENILGKVKKAGVGDYSVEQIEKMRSTLLQYQQTLTGTGDDAKRKFEEIGQAVSKLDTHQAQVNAKQIDFGKFLKEIDTKGLNETRKAYELLKNEVSNLSPKATDFNEKMAQLQGLKKHVDDMTAAVENQGNAFSRTMARLGKYIMTFVSFNSVALKIKSLLPEIAELSDQMTTLEKVSGLTADETDRVVRSLQSWDVRGTTKELMDLAVQAGKLGVAARGGADAVTQFVKAGQMVTSTLGDDIGGAQAVSDLLKVNDLVNKSGESIEKSMNRIGSSILVVGNNSTASYANVTEFVGRLGAVGEAAHLTMSEIIGLGGTLDALKQPVEASSTAMGKLLVGMQVNADGLAEKAKVSVAELRQLLAEGKTMEGLFLLLEGVEQQGKGIAPIRELLREIGGRYSQNLLSTFAVLMNNMPMLRQQLGLAERGFQEATQMAYEFDKANDNLAGSAKRLGNSLKELVVNDSTVSFLKTLTDAIRPVIDSIVWLEKNVGIISATAMFFVGKALNPLLTGLGHLKNAITGNTVALGRMRLAWQSFTTFLKTNALGLILAVGTALYNIIERQKEANRALGAMSEAMNEATTSASAMFERLLNLNNALAKVNPKEKEAKELLDEKARLIAQINEKYGTYLGFMLSEVDTATSIALAHDLVISKLKEEYALKMQNQAVEQANEQNKDDKNEAVGDVLSYLKKQIGAEEAGEAMTIISRILTENIGGKASANSIRVKIEKELKKRWSDVSLAYDSGIIKWIDTQRKINNEAEALEAVFRGEGKGEKVNSSRSAVRLAKEIYREMQELEQKTDRTNQENKRLAELANRLLSLKDKVNDSGERKLRDSVIERASRIVEQYGQSSVWGKEGKDLTTLSIKNLVERYNGLVKNMQTVTDSMTAENFRQVYPDYYDDSTMRNFSAQDMRDWMRERIDELKVEFDRRRLTTAGKPKWPADGDRTYQRQMKEEMDMSLKRLEEYYNKRKTVIEQYQAEELISEEEYERRMSQEQRDYLTDRAKLRDQWMGNAVTYVHDEDVREIMKGVKFAEIAKFLATEGEDGGKHLVDGLKAAIAKDGLDVQKELSKLVNIRRAALLEYQPMQKVLTDFRKSMEELDILYGEKASMEERLEQNSGERRMSIIESFISKIQGMTESQFATELKQYSDFSRFTEDETRLLYERLLQLRDDYEQAARRMVVKDMRMLNNQVESGEWYKEQLDKFRRFLEEREALLSAATDGGSQQLRDEVAAGRTLVNYMSARQNTVNAGGASESYAQRSKKELELMKQRLKAEQQLKEQGVANDLQISMIELGISRRELKAASETLLVRKSIYSAKVKALEDSIRAEKAALKDENMSEEERMMRTQIIGNMETELMITRQQYAEAIKEANEDLLKAETDFTKKEMALFSTRHNQVREFAESLQQAWNAWTVAGANAREESAASIALAAYQESIARAELSQEELAKTANEDLPAALQKTRYAIYNNKGVIEDVWLTPLEKLKKEQEIAVENAKKIAKNEYIDQMSAKLKESIDDALKRAATEQELRNSEQRKQAILDEMQRGSLAIQILNEKEATDAIYAYKIQKEQEWQQMRAQNAMNSAMQAGVAGADDGMGGLINATHQLMMNNLAEELGMVQTVEVGKRTAMQQTNKVQQNVSKEGVRTEQKDSQTKANLTKNMAASMIQSINLYGIAYDVVSNDNLSSTEKANAIILQTTGQMINTVLSVLMQEAIAHIVAKKAEGEASAWAINPYLAAGIIAAMSVGLGIAMASMKSAVGGAQTEIASLTGTENTNSASKASVGRLSRGMLTYAEGNVDTVLGDGRVQVHGADGKDYNAKYKPALSTGIYKEPHLGIVGEAGAELIVDHGTLNVLRKDNPEVLRAIYNARMFGRTMLDYEGLNRSATMLGTTWARSKARTAGIRTFADGNVSDVLGGGMENGGASIEKLNTVMNQVLELLTTMNTEGVRTDFHFGGRDGFSKEDKKYNNWEKRHGLR